MDIVVVVVLVVVVVVVTLLPGIIGEAVNEEGKEASRLIYFRLDINHSKDNSRDGTNLFSPPSEFSFSLSLKFHHGI